MCESRKNFSQYPFGSITEFKIIQNQVVGIVWESRKNTSLDLPYLYTPLRFGSNNR